MNESQTIIKAFTQAKQKGKNTALATVVNVKGSAYRRPGAKMLITEDGDRTGAISGGCLEEDVGDRALKVITTNKPIVVTYNTSSNEDILWGLGMGCDGVIQVLIEPLNLLYQKTINFITDCFDQRQSGVIATIFQGTDDISISSRILIQENGKIIQDFNDPELIETVIADAKLVRSTKHSQTKSYSLSGGTVEVFLELIEPPISLLIFGAGDDAMPVVQLAKILGWNVTVVDHRPAYGTANRFPLADELVICYPDGMAEKINLNYYDAAVVMTHNYLRDRDLLKILFSAALNYIGLLGSRQRINKILADLGLSGFPLTTEQDRGLYAPVGLDIGAENPAEIALAIIAEIKAVLAGRNSGFLKDKKPLIYQLPTSESHDKIGSIG